MASILFTYQIFWYLLDLIFPPECAGCKKAHIKWCSECQEKVVVLKEPVCSICGIPVMSGGLCAACAKIKPHFTALRAWAVYQDPIRLAIHKLKYRRDLSLGYFFSKYLVNLFRQQTWVIDQVIPIPLNKFRKEKRGYNQAALLAYPFAHEIGIPYNPQALLRIKDTKSQVDLDHQARVDNVAGAFLADNRKVGNKSLLLIDDVSTSGSTINAAAEACLAAGAQQVYGLTLARTISHI